MFAPGAPPQYGLDFQSNYLDWWLRFIGITDIQIIRYQPSLLTQDPAKGFNDAVASARNLEIA